MKYTAVVFLSALAFSSSIFAAEALFERAKLQLVVEQADELLAEANRKGSETHTPACQYYFGLVYGSGTNLLARKESVATTTLVNKYMKQVERDYEAYTKVEKAAGMAAATGSVRGKSGSRHRAKRTANAEKLGQEELAKAIKRWEAFATQLRKTR